MQFNEFLATLAQGLLAVSLPVLIVAVAYWLKQHGDEIKSRLGKERLSALESIGAIAVRAAEQAGLTKQIVGGGAKKEYALKMAQDYFISLGIKIDVKTVASVVESEVLRQFNTSAPPADSPATRVALIDKAVECAVLAEQKKAYALGLARKYLDDNGLKVDMAVVDGLIEAQIMKFKIQAAQAAARQ